MGQHICALTAFLDLLTGNYKLIFWCIFWTFQQRILWSWATPSRLTLLRFQVKFLGGVILIWVFRGSSIAPPHFCHLTSKASVCPLSSGYLCETRMGCSVAINTCHSSNPSSAVFLHSCISIHTPLAFLSKKLYMRQVLTMWDPSRAKASWKLFTFCLAGQEIKALSTNNSFWLAIQNYGGRKILHTVANFRQQSLWTVFLFTCYHAISIHPSHIPHPCLCIHSPISLIIPHNRPIRFLLRKTPFPKSISTSLYPLLSQNKNVNGDFHSL